MRTPVLAAAAAAALAGVVVAGTFDPAFDKAIDLGTFTLASDASGPLDEFIYSYTVQGGEVAFSFSGDFFDVAGPTGGMWASDTRLQIFRNGMEVYNVGGFSGVVNPWDFQGGGSAPDGFYSHGPDFAVNGLAVAGDVWDFRFTNGWNSSASTPIEWSNATLTLHKIPAPAALAVLGLAGLAGGRRRRA